MQKVLLLLVLIIPYLSIAQKGIFKVNVVGGINSAFAIGPDAKQDRSEMKKSETEYSAKDGGSYSGRIYPRLGIHLGGTVDYYLTEKVSLTGGLIFSQRGYTRMVKYAYNQTYPIDYKKSYENRTKVKLNYIDLPIMAKYFFTKYFYINAGFQFCFLASEKYIEKKEFNETELDNGEYKVVNIIEENTSSADAKGFLGGFRIGAGITKKNVGLELNISKTGVPLRVIGISYGYPNLLLQCGLTYRIYPKNN